MTRPVTDSQRVADLIASGVSQAETARRTGIPRATLREWVKLGLEDGVVLKALALPVSTAWSWPQTQPADRPQGMARAYCAGRATRDAVARARALGRLPCAELGERDRLS